MKNLGVLDAQAGFPLTNGKMDLTTENIQDYWAGSAEARVKFGMFIDEEDGREINFVRGFAYDRAKMRKPAVAGQQQAGQQQTDQQQASGPAYTDPIQQSNHEQAATDDIDF
jgi:hypothetical protein